ncbi:hypothetical protein GGR70_002281 [Xanthomonas campestris]|nr:hypothetical protein [Xanthomonas campestris]
MSESSRGGVSIHAPRKACLPGLAQGARRADRPNRQ